MIMDHFHLENARYEQKNAAKEKDRVTFSDGLVPKGPGSAL
jgi:hypothetical protein